ncbi:MAG: 3-isopropylmalate dehydratase small subunit [Gammaproteobacteria bacterium]|jgi:3-isopropylmalate/(R)-2-methylmalate dehydratase small subunit|nr:3-isopropylmalate dehydratase small subunit [Gammaproteobacteria bacterium]
MQAFTKHTGTVAPLERVNVDTDQIIPKQFLKSIKRTGFGDYLFDGWRFVDEGDLGMTPNERQLNHDFVLNQPAYQGASILLARDNFGCGSSREHAVWALQEFGFCVVLAPSFADIFYGNCFKNGLLPVVLNEREIDQLFHDCGQGYSLTVDLERQQVETSAGAIFNFQIDQGLKEKMLKGLDDISMTLAERALIESFEAKHRQSQPWLFLREE